MAWKISILFSNVKSKIQKKLRTILLIAIVAISSLSTCIAEFTIGNEIGHLNTGSSSYLLSNFMHTKSLAEIENTENLNFSENDLNISFTTITNNSGLNINESNQNSIGIFISIMVFIFSYIYSQFTSRIHFFISVALISKRPYKRCT